MAYGKGSVNKVTLLGRLGKDPELKYLPNGTAVANFSIATSLAWKDQTSNEQKEQTEWHKIVAWKKTSEIAAQYLKKGDQVYIEGRLQTRSWDDKDGVKRYTTEVVAENLVLIGSKGNNSGSGSSISEPTEEFAGAGSATKNAAPNAGIHDDIIPVPSDDDGLPF